MFKRYTVKTELVKTPRKSQTPTESTVAPDPTPSWIEKIQRKDVVHTTVGAVAVYASVKAVNTLSTIAINYAPKN